ncbi:MAG: hypothetical protein EAX86_09620, partial [Candidatus Heimdallarchaeota archaeon]|nr:hypothetical protein [Candidatus Heimdallarchaeota archaeon]
MIVLDQWLMSPFHIGGTLLLLMILDLGLTRVGFRMKQQEFVKHYVSEIYEMNPLMQDMIHQTQPMSLKQIIGRIGLVILVIYVAVEYTGTWFLEFVTGNFVLGYINIELRALENIFIFRGLNNHPEYVEGQIKLDIRYQYL